MTGLAGPRMAARGRAATTCTPALVHLSGTTGAGCWARRRGDRPPVSGLMKVLLRDGFVPMQGAPKLWGLRHDAEGMESMKQSTTCNKVNAQN